MTAVTKRIAVVTGSRAEYGLLRTTLAAIATHQQLDLHIVVVGMHLVRKLGYTISDILADGWDIAAEVPMYSAGDAVEQQPLALARGVEGISSAVNELNADVVLVVGDRIEALAGALAGTLSGRFVAHIHGGERAPGFMDDTIRHTITKLAHLHLPATHDARRRLIQLGEAEDTIVVCGAPGLDEIVALPDAPEGFLECELKIESRHAPVVVLQHPVGRHPDDERQTMDNILEVVSELDAAPVVIYPNSDPGHTGIIDSIEQWKSRLEGVRVFRSLPRTSFLHLMKMSGVLIGNSSCGVIESATLGVGVVNVGPRQDYRERSGPAVIDCSDSPEQLRKTLAEVRKLTVRPERKTVYGNGKGGHNIAQALAGFVMSDKLRRKHLTY